MIRVLQSFSSELFRRFFPYRAFDEGRSKLRLINLNSLCRAHESVKFFPECDLYNRLERNRITIGKGTIVRGELLLFDYGKELVIGEHVYIGAESRIWSGASITIGNNVLISHHCNIIGSNCHELNPESRANSFKQLIKNGHPKEQGDVQTGDIVIEDNVWINFNVTILKNVRIGKGAIVASNSLVMNDVPPHTLVGGYPAKVLKKLAE